MAARKAATATSRVLLFIDVYPPGRELYAIIFAELSQIPAIPANDPRAQVLEVGKLAEMMALARIDEELRGRTDGLERMPVFERLRRGAFHIALADIEQHRRPGALDEFD